MLLSKRYETFKICEKDGTVISTFEGAKLANRCLPGDSVRSLENGCGCELVERAQHPPLVGVIEFQSKIKYGYSGRNNPIYLFKPFDDTYPPMLVGSKENTRANQIGIALFDGWDAGSTFPRAVLQKIIGPCGDRNAEIEAIALQYSPWQWGKKQLNTPFASVSNEGRYDLTEKPTINIDPEGCQDIDDCISLWKEENKWILAISIADVAAFLDVNPVLLEHAEKIGQTLYMDGRAVRPLLPPVLSENALSLLAGEVRNTITLFAEWLPGKLTNFQWHSTILRNKASYTYENCYGAKEIPMDILADISSHLLGRKETDSHKWIESFMILYNEKAAEILWDMKSGFLRAHSEPDRERFEKFESLGLPGKQLAFPAAVYMDVIGKEKDSLKHFGLSRGLYCHASSPIRRFPDIVNQFVLHAYLEKKDVSSQKNHTAFQLNSLMKKGKAFERDYHFLQVLFEKNSCYEKGIVVSVGGEKVEVYIPAWKRICKVKTGGGYIEGQEVQVAFYVNMAERNWKQRILIRLDALAAQI